MGKIKLKVKEVLKEKRLSIKVLAKELGVTPSAVSQKINNDDVSLQWLLLVAKIIGTDVSNLYVEEDDNDGMLKSDKFYLVSLNYENGGQDIISYDKAFAYSYSEELLKSLSESIKNAEIIIKYIEVDDNNSTEQAFYDGNVKIKHEQIIRTINVNLKQDNYG